MRIDDGCNGIGRIVEAVHELKTEGYQEGYAQQDVGVYGRASLNLQVLRKANDGVNQTNNKSHSENDHSNHSGALCQFLVYCGCRCGCGSGHSSPSACLL